MRWIHTSRSRNSGTWDAGIEAPLGAVTSERHECAGISRHAFSKRTHAESRSALITCRMRRAPSSMSASRSDRDA
ncbi:hypothetical protein UK23_12910 [Lentzea aerocolonigenes]|uniref:Uncharacterized protein n=1 Tax=Lentzea aerocolonigenes TaxID=68170 RepID=A0A0F0H304_LENAE|nr:hypothetical protein UK23_12910 [Lentzea aerocolonigenes]